MCGWASQPDRWALWLVDMTGFIFNNQTNPFIDERHSREFHFSQWCPIRERTERAMRPTIMMRWRLLTLNELCPFLCRSGDLRIRRFAG